MHKVTGALADLGYSVDDVYAIGKLVGENMVSVGVSLDKAHVPGKASKQDTSGLMTSGEVESDMGIHNETGCAILSGADAELPAVVSKMLAQMLDVEVPDRCFLPYTTPEMVLLVTNMSTLPSCCTPMVSAKSNCSRSLAVQKYPQPLVCDHAMSSYQNSGAVLA